MRRYLVCETVPFQSSDTFTNKLKHIPHKKTELGCTNFDAGLHRHLTIPPKLGGIARGACSQEQSWFAQCSPGPTRETLPRTGSLLLLSARSRKGSRSACTKVVRLRSGEQTNLLHRTMIGRPTKYSSGNPKALDYLLP